MGIEERTDSAAGSAARSADEPQPRKYRLVASALVFGVLSLLYLAGALQFLDNKLLDARFALFGRDATKDMVIVAIDPESLAEYGTWPWPRDYHAEVIEKLLAAGASRIAFDIDFSSVSNPKSDARLARALAVAGDKAVLAAFKQRRQSSAHETGTGTSATLLTLPRPEFRNTAHLGSVNVFPDPDGVVRRAQTSDESGDSLLESLPAQLGGIDIESNRSFIIDFGIRPNTIAQVSYADVLAGRYRPEQFANKVVLIGGTAVQLGDHLTVPHWSVLPGVKVLALRYQSLIQGRALHPISPIWVAAGTFLLVLLFSWRCGQQGWRQSLGLLAVVWTLALGAAAAAHVLGYVLDIALVILGSGLCFVGGVVSKSNWQALKLLAQGRLIRTKDKMMRGVVNNSFDAILVMDDTGTVTEVNPAARSMFGWNATSLVGRPITDFVPSAAHLIPRNSMHLAPRPEYTRNEMTARRADGTHFPVELAMREMVTEDGAWLIAFVRDITERRRHQEELEYQAHHDALTGLPNRNFLYRRLRDTLRESAHTKGQFAVLILDLDRFKEINDTLGHHTGDELLKQISARLKKPLRRSDVIARLGGDEFAILISPMTDRETVTAVAKRLHEALEAPVACNGLNLSVGASIGAAVFPDHGAEVSELIQRADIAMYVAKSTGVPLAFYDQDTDRHSVRQLTLNGELKRAIEENALSVYFQPKISVATREVVGAECLLRWQHPEHGFVPPDEFVRLAEQTGVIEKLTEWVLNAVLAQGAKWRKQGIELDLAVNLSAKSLQDTKLISTVSYALARHGIPAQRLILEITESAIMADPESARSIIDALHALGVKLSIDDFGTGYSSLGYLKRLPVQELKIDKSFVMDMLKSDNDGVIVRSTIDLAHNLGLSVVAEGVESEEILERLEALDADVAQGYFISRPVAAATFAEWLRAWTPRPAREPVRGQAPQPRFKLLSGGAA
ncbi:MAG: EAL domain-containing protein [Alphaproteobacteria bacterium]